MNVLLWVVAGFLAFVFLLTGLLKLVRTKEQLAATGIGWVEDFGPGTIRLIGVVEVLGAAGLILPAVTGIAEVLVPVAAIGLTLNMLGAMSVHIRRKEPTLVVLTAVLAFLAAFLAWGRLVLSPFS
ncbi:DoxX family protein [Cellulomonas chitinilytica]|nr:DoxX family protein [Cellulomonas chitinilytica]